MSKKITRIIFWVIAVILGLTLIYQILAFVSYDKNRTAEIGINFSQKYSKYLGLDWRDNYIKILDELNIKYLRLSAYWDEIEPNEGEYYFEEIDWMLNEAGSRNVKVILTLGLKQPRWPECHIPAWASELSGDEFNEKISRSILTTVERYKSSPVIEAWQVENEPLLRFFGICPKIEYSTLIEEVELVKSLDDRPILITASGELSSWIREINIADIFGSTMYRTTYNKHYGYGSYWFVPSSLYRIKAFLNGLDLENFWIVELQAEPWFIGDPLTTSLDEQFKTMNADLLVKNYEYAKQSNPGRIYFWGAEWWYYLKETYGEDKVWEKTKELIK